MELSRGEAAKLIVDGRDAVAKLREEVAAAVRDGRAKAKLSVHAMADRAGVKPSVVRSWEAGEALPTVVAWKKLRMSHAFQWHTWLQERITKIEKLERSLDGADLVFEAIDVCDPAPAMLSKVALGAAGVDVAAFDASTPVEPSKAEMRQRAAVATLPWAEAATFGEALRLARVAEGLNQASLGDLIGVSKTTISSWELDVTLPVKPLFDKILSLFPGLSPLPHLVDLRDIEKPNRNPTGSRDRPGRGMSVHPRAYSHMVRECATAPAEAISGSNGTPAGAPSAPPEPATTPGPEPGHIEAPTPIPRRGTLDALWEALHFTSSVDPKPGFLDSELSLRIDCIASTAGTPARIELRTQPRLPSGELGPETHCWSAPTIEEAARKALASLENEMADNLAAAERQAAILADRIAALRGLRRPE